MISMKKRIGVGTVGLVALGASVVGVALSSGLASASSTPTTAPSVVTIPGGNNVQDIAGANLQLDSQTGLQSVLPDATEGTSSEATATESANVESDGVGGAQETSGSNVDSQTAGAQ